MSETSSNPAQPSPVADGVSSGESDLPELLDLDDERARAPEFAGGKAAALARARAIGVRTLPGLVLTTEVCRRADGGIGVDELSAIDEAYERMSTTWSAETIARSSSVVEDQESTSAAGQFDSVPGVDGLDELRQAVGVVFDSRRQADAEGQPIAVLLQPQVQPQRSGVLFGVDPVSGRSDRRVVAVVDGRPDQLVGGEVEGSRYVTDTDGEIVEAEVRDGVEIERDMLRTLVEVADRLALEFDGAQDLEWAVIDDELVVLQTRPVTTEVRGVPSGPIYGPGVVAETFPDPLSRLECDLWIPPLREAVREALVLSGRWRRAELDGRPLVVTVDGRAAIDLEMTGTDGDTDVGTRRSWLRDRLEKLRSAWRVGRLRAALPRLVDDLIDRVDDDLADLPPLDELTSRQLVALIARVRPALRSVHAHEILSGLLAASTASSFTGTSVALRVLVELRHDGVGDDDIVERAPVVLAASAPRVGARPELPSDITGFAFDAAPDVDDGQLRRESLRLRVRWLHELTARAAWELGVRLEARRVLDEVADVRHLDVDVLDALVAHRACVVSSVLRAARARERTSDALPTRFRLSDTGRPIRVDEEGGAAGTGAGGGTAEGVVTHDVSDPPDGSVLVVGSLEPGLSSTLGTVSAIVAESGSVLSHLAILAREQGVAVVVGRRGAVDDLADGERVAVDGDTGGVIVVEEPAR